MKFYCQIFLYLIVLCSLARSEVSYTSLKGFWEATYDHDADGRASLDDFLRYFKLMEPEEEIPLAECASIFNFFDADLNKEVTLDELIRIARLKVTYNPGHKQIHLGLTAN